MAKNNNSPLERRILQNTVDVLRLGNNLASELFLRLTAVRDDILDKLDEATAFGEARLNRILAQVDGALLSAQDDELSLIKDHRREVIQSEYTTITHALGVDADADLETKLPISTLGKLIENPVGGRPLGDWVAGAFGKLTQGIKQSLFSSAATGAGSRQAADAIRDQFGLSRRASAVIARTSLLQASNDARNQVYEDHSDLIKSYSYMATLDSRTCEICAPWDGVTEEDRGDLPETPQHPNCRCTVRPNTRFASPITRPAVVEFSSRTVKHRDGSTSTKFSVEKAIQTNMNFEAFFNGQSAEWQRGYLGAKQYELFKANKLSFNDLKRRAGVSRMSLNAFKTR